MDYGKIIQFHQEKGYGFIAPDRGGADLFVHISALDRTADVRQLQPGTAVSFEETVGTNNRPKAAQVRVVTSRPEDAWPEYAEPVPVQGQPMTEEGLRQLLHAAVEYVLDNARDRGWL